jgi:hypothetical protein
MDRDKDALMNEMPREVLLGLEDVKGRVTEEDGCLRWKGKIFLGYDGGDLLYGVARGLIGRGYELGKCPRHEWCVDPWHRKAIYHAMKNEWTCRWGHQLDDRGKCKECERVKKAKWRSKVQLMKAKSGY